MPEIGELIGSGMVADVHVYGERALKLYHPGRGKEQAFLEATVLSVLEGHDLPAPRVYAVGEFGGRWGLIMDRVAGGTLGDRAIADASQAGPVLDEMVRLQLMLHAAKETRLRPLKLRLRSNIERAPLLDAPLREHLLAKLRELPDGDCVCHGDFHPLNIIGAPGQSTIIDWLDATSGSPSADACRTYVLLRVGAAAFAEPYLDLYAARSGIERADILAWLPCVTAARLTEDAGDSEFLFELAKST